MQVKAHLPRGGHITGKVMRIDRSSNFARAYGAQATLDTGYTVGVGDVFEIIDAIDKRVTEESKQA